MTTGNGVAAALARTKERKYSRMRGTEPVKSFRMGRHLSIGGWSRSTWYLTVGTRLDGALPARTEQEQDSKSKITLPTQAAMMLSGRGTIT